MERGIIFCSCCRGVIKPNDKVYLEELPMDGGFAYICDYCITPKTLDQGLINEFWKENPEYFEDDYQDYLDRNEEDDTN